MKTSTRKRWKSGFVSYLLVLSTGAILTSLTIFTYRRAMAGQEVQSQVQLRLDYAEKEEAILRSIVAITPNRAIRAMKHNSNVTGSARNQLRWQNIFTESIALANAGSSISSQVAATLDLGDAKVANFGDSALTDPTRIFNHVGGATNYRTAWISGGINRSLGVGYPVPLETSESLTITNDRVFPVISNDKVYGSLAQTGVGLPVATYPQFNLLTYPQINFGYARPGDPFVAKRNWWAFSVDVADHDNDLTKLALSKRNYVLSIYEVPSQLAISASSFMSLGKFASGESWQNVTLDGGIFAGKAEVEGETALSALASRRGMTLSEDATIGGQSFNSSPFTPGVRETYQLTEGAFFPVSQASESGRAAFVPINRGKEFFDRFDPTNVNEESNAVSATTWNNYSVGALQCAMQLDIIGVTSASNKMPTVLRFSFMKDGERQSYVEPLVTGITSGLPPGYTEVRVEGQTHNFGDDVVDVAYGKNGQYYFQTDVTGQVAFTNARFGDPIPGTFKSGFFRPSAPYKIKELPSGKICVAIYPKRFKDFLTLIGADSTAVNHSIVVNVDYTTATGSILLTQPSIPCTDMDYGVILQESDDLTSFTKGFSLVTNLRLYFGDDFNTVPTTPPAGYSPPGLFYPPCSIFTPEKRYGVQVDAFAVNLSGQIGSLAQETDMSPVRPLDSKNRSGEAMASDRITVNLRPITHPGELPPITMMNWLVLLEERRREYY